MFRKYFLSILFIFLVFLSTILIQNCESNPQSFESKSLSVVPSSGVIGTKLKIFGVPFDTSDYAWRITFSNVGDFIWADSNSVDTIYTYVPFGAQSGDIKLNSLDDSLLIKDFLVTEECADNVNISWSNLNYKIDKKASIFTIMPVISEFIWSVENIQDTIKISAGYYPGDFCIYYHLHLLDKGVNQLPQFLSGYALEETDYGAERIFDLDKGIIKIQDWHVDSLISGRVFSTPWNNNYSFWYKFDK